MKQQLGWMARGARLATATVLAAFSMVSSSIAAMGPHALPGAAGSLADCLLCHRAGVDGAVGPVTDGDTVTAACLDCHQETWGGRPGDGAVHGRSHPVGVAYPSAWTQDYATPGRADAGGAMVAVAGQPLGEGLPLYAAGGRVLVQCASCHQPHGNGAQLLRVANTESRLCYSCHRL